MKDFNLAPSGHQLLIVGGVHGAGKSSFCREFAGASGWPWLTNQVIRAEHIDGAALSRDEVHALSRERVAQYIAAGRSFAFEHVMSGRYADALLDAADAGGFSAHLVYLDLCDATLSAERVDARSAKGGHDVEREKIARRLDESRANFWQRYRVRARSWALFDNSGPQRRLVARRGEQGESEHVDSAALERFIERAR